MNKCLFIFAIVVMVALTLVIWEPREQRNIVPTVDRSSESDKARKSLFSGNVSQKNRESNKTYDKQKHTEVYQRLKNHPEARRFLNSDSQDLYARRQEDPRALEDLFYGARKVISELAPCLANESLCGQKKLYKEETYFAPESTPLHQQLNRALNVTALALGHSSDLYYKIEPQVLVRAVGVQHANIPVVATTLLLDHPNRDLAPEILDQSRKLHGRAKALVFEQLAQSGRIKNSALRTDFLEELNLTLANEGARDTASALRHRLYKYDLSEKEFRKAARKACSLSSNKTGENIRARIRHNLQVQAERSNVNVQVAAICS